MVKDHSSEWHAKAVMKFLKSVEFLLMQRQYRTDLQRSPVGSIL